MLYLDLGLESGTTADEYTADVTFKGYYTPSGDLVCEASNQVEVAVVDIEMTRPDDKPNSQYFHYVYDENADPNGVCEVRFMVQIMPDTENVRNILKDEISCSIDSIAESILSWKNNGDANTGILEYLLLLVVLTSNLFGGAADLSDNSFKQAGKFITALERDDRGRVWIGTEDAGVLVCDPAGDGKLEQFTTEDGLGDNNAYALACDGQGRIWAGNLRHGVSVYNGVFYNQLLRRSIWRRFNMFVSM